MRRTFVLLFAAVSLGCASTAPAPSLSSRVDALIHQPPFDRAFWSILIEDDRGRVLYGRNADKLTIPASNRKLFAAATIVSCLGVDKVLETSIWRDGENLIVRGDGDPSLGSWRYERSGDFEAVATQLAGRGIRRANDVVADVSAFDRITIPGGWKHGNLGSDYAAPVDALAWEESELPGDRATLEPALHTAEAFRTALIGAGIEVAGIARVETEPRNWNERLLSIPSPFVGELLATVLKNSHNLYTEMLFKRSSGGTYEGSFALERVLLTGEPGVEADTFRFVDGSGLAPDDLVAPVATVRLLRWLNRPVRRGYWWSILAQPGEGGTLRRRLTELSDRMRGKTGTINGVNALSGILAMDDGTFRYFSIAVNHHIGDGDAAVEIIDAIVRAAAAGSEVPGLQKRSRND